MNAYSQVPIIWEKLVHFSFTEVFQKRATFEEIFLIIWRKHLPGPYTNWKRPRNSLLLFLSISEASFIIATFIFKYISFSTGPIPNRYDYMRIPVVSPNLFFT